MSLFTNNYGSQAPYRNSYSPSCVIIDLQMLHMSWLWKEVLTPSPLCLNVINWAASTYQPLFWRYQKIKNKKSHCPSILIPLPPTQPPCRECAISWERKVMCTVCPSFPLLSSAWCPELQHTGLLLGPWMHHVTSHPWAQVHALFFHLENVPCLDHGPYYSFFKCHS